ncbi:hypothetical protein [Cryobacterium sp. TMT2-23]|uniref:hypothetical protein n=1 Tax=Cryobacterium sp. TMT2-23 TaxID=1259252 RepID=UPI00106CD81E|nr:hypothetical protein [Cryobacterium sp. TMT2-23]TFD23816.1 hypothetical protein E3T32_05040 [Cryobacterium sp. TMT2-23]
MIPPIPPIPPGYANLSPEHATELAASSIPPEIAAKHGVYTAELREDLPEWAQWMVDVHGDGVLPALVYPMMEPDGSVTGQVKPQPGTVVDKGGKTIKYISPSGSENSPQLPVVRKVDAPVGVLLVEGVKQALAADAWAPADWSIYRFCGITGWSRNGLPSAYLEVVEDLDVVIVPDADAATNSRVFDGAVKLGKACKEWTEKVSFTRIEGAGTTGIDDRLGEVDGAERRRKLVARWISRATAKPADSRPKEDNRASSATVASSPAGRPVVNVGDDRLKVTELLEKILRDSFDGTELFRHGDTLGHLAIDEDGPVIENLSDGTFNRLVSRAAETIKVSDRGIEKHEWPDSNTLKSLVAGYRGYTRVDGVSSVPVVRRDGSIVTETGYDPETRLFIALSDDIQGIVVPDHPSTADIAEAKRWLLEELLVDERKRPIHGFSGFPFKEDADVAHAVAAYLTPLIRKLVPLVPLCVIDGLTSRVGKGLFLECLVRVMTGYPPDLTNLPKDDEQELRKLLTSMFLGGRTFFVFDEAHVINSAVLCQALTAQIWSDRLLGGNKQARLRNVGSWYAAGNKVERSGDVANRAYSVRLHTTEPNPQGRANFKHDLNTWVPEHRAELLRSCLILVRAWFDADCPKPLNLPAVLGGFEQWRDVIGGILQVAGIEGFLASVEEERLESNFEEQYQRAHVASLADKFGTGVAFTSKQGAIYLVNDADAEAPYGQDALKEKEDPRALGRCWRSMADVWYDKFRLVKVGQSHGNVASWMIERHDAAITPDAAVTVAAPVIPLPVASSSTKERIPDESGRPMPVITDIDEEEAA